MREGFANLYTVGSVGKLEGTFKETISGQTKGFGRAVKSTIDRYIEIEGGAEPYNTENKDGKLIVSTIENENHPFNTENIKAMKDKIEEKLTKSKEKDAAKNANTKQISNDEVPF